MVKCKDCGLLAARCARTNEVIEASGTCRVDGYLRNDRRQTQTVQLFCSVGEPECPAEFIDARSIKDTNPAYRDTLVKGLTKELSCSRFVPYLEGKTASEHEEMDIVRKLNELHEKQRREDIERQDTHEDRIDKRFRMYLLVQFLLAVLGGVVALIGAKLLPFFKLPQ